uniref:Uncharacterized protein n=1 Tax=Panagrolaimus sp. JU765 TaxID=591449 RepID=A0AC34QDK7_9BILA
MDNSDGLLGIAGDRKFINAFYVYRKSKKDLKNIDNEDEIEREKIEYICCIYYLKALHHVFSKIHERSEGENKGCYLDYLRWNQNIIRAKLHFFKNIPHLQDMIRITEFENDFKLIFEENFQLTTEDKGIVNQYVHAYECVRRYDENEAGKKYKLALQHSGRLFINYVNILKTRGYTRKLDRDDVTFEDVQKVAKDLVTRLKDVDVNLKNSVQETFELFKDYREFDDGCATTNDELIVKALKLAHSRFIKR